MLPLLVPTGTPVRDFALCIQNVRNPDCRNRLQKAEAKVGVAFQEYTRSAPLHSLHQIEPIADNDAELNSCLRNNYLFMSASGRSLRVVYDKIFNSVPFKLCPYCGARSAKTLDHFLPKDTYGEFSIFGPNLVPACYECNVAKSNYRSRSEEGNLFHPYFEEHTHQQFLFADVLIDRAVKLIYSVNPPNDWERNRRTRIINAFKVFSLAELYSILGAQLLSNMKRRCIGYFEVGGWQAVRDEMRNEAESYAAGVAGPNGWQTACFRALGNSREFCNGGFMKIGSL